MRTHERAVTFAGMSPRARIVDPLVLDAITAAMLLAAIELQVWLSPSEQHSWPAALGGVALAVAIALRRRFSLEALLAGVGALVLADVYGARLGEHAIGSLLAGVLLFGAVGRWEPRRRALAGLAGSSR
jgi:MYXO-CTERM domain-containing protein